MSLKKILKKIRCSMFCCFKSSCSYNDNGSNDGNYEPKKKEKKNKL